MSQERLQTYFDKHQVKKLASGAQAEVYGDQSLVVKNLRQGSLQRVVKLFVDPTNSTDTVAIVRKTHEDGLDALGNLAVPYEMPPEICLQIQKRLLWWSSVQSLTLQRPVVQARTRPENSLNTRLRVAMESGDTAETERLLQEVLRLNKELTMRGFHPYDAVSSNYTLDRENRLRVQDIGALVSDARFVDVLQRFRERMLSNCLFSFKLASPSAVLSSPEIRKLLDDFDAGFRDIYLKPTNGGRSRRERCNRMQRMPRDVLSTVEKWN